nr:AlpA family phage regulatory protein [Mesorhizobium sp. J8]
MHMVKQLPSSELDISGRTGQPEPLPVLPHLASRPVVRTIRRSQLREIVPLSDTTIYEMEQRGEFPRRFNLPPLRRLGLGRSRSLDRAAAERIICRQDPASNAPDVERKARPVKSDQE